MLRKISLALVLSALVVVSQVANAADAAKKNQMVKGTIATVNVADNVLVVKQNVGKEKVDRQLNFNPNTVLILNTDKGQEEYQGVEAMKFLADAVGASIAVKCDKDVNVLKVTVTLKKK